MQVDARYIVENHGTGSKRSLTPDSKGRLRINCPVHHGDGENCLVWDADNGDVLFHCPKECPSAEIASHFPELRGGPPNRKAAPGERGGTSRAKGMKGMPGNNASAPAFIPKPHIPQLTEAEIAGPWVYRDADGTNSIRVERTPGKQFPTQGWKNGSWQLKGALPSPRPLYNLLELAISTSPVLIVEGEKACHGAMHLFPKCVCTTWSGGKGNWNKSDWSVLAGRDVTIWPDKEDSPEKQADTTKHINALAAHLHSLACRVRIVDITDVPPGYDLANPIEAVEGYLAAARPYDPNAIECGGIEGFRIKSSIELMSEDHPPAKMLVDGLVPEGFTILVAPPKVGKTFFCQDMACCIATGRDFLGLQTEQMRVLYIDAEQNERLIFNRMKALGWDKGAEGLYYIPNCTRMLDKQVLDEISSQIRGRFGLVILDTLAMLCPQSRSGADSYQKGTEQLRPIKKWAQDLGINVIAIHHSRKPTGNDSGESYDVISGSRAYVGVADTTAILERIEEEEFRYRHSGRVAEPGDFRLQRDGASWKMLGDYVDDSISDLRQLIIKTLQTKGKPCSPKGIADSIDQPADTVRKNLDRMSKQKNSPLVRRVGHGLYEFIQYDPEDWPDGL